LSFHDAQAEASLDPIGSLDRIVFVHDGEDAINGVLRVAQMTRLDMFRQDQGRSVGSALTMVRTAEAKAQCIADLKGGRQLARPPIKLQICILKP
jgi:hypothetical protein